MNRLLVLLLTATLALSGCFGYPEGSATPGSTVTADVVALDAETGEVLVWSLSSATLDGSVAAGALAQEFERVLGDDVPASLEAFLDDGLVSAADVAAALDDAGLLHRFGAPVTFVAGGQSDLGSDFVAGVLGVPEGSDVTFVSRDDPSLSKSKTVTTPSLLGRSPAEGDVDLATYEAQIGPAPAVGDVFEFNIIYDAEVVAVTEDTVTYRFHIEGERQEDPADVVGAILVSYIEGDELVRLLEPNVGATFEIAPPSAFQPSPLGLEAGSYRTVGMDEDDNLVYEVVSVRFPAVVGRDVEYRVHVVDVSAAPEAEMEGAYGVRHSPVVRGDPATVGGDRVLGGGHDHDDHAHDDGHDHDHDHGHDHGHGHSH